MSEINDFESESESEFSTFQNESIPSSSTHINYVAAAVQFISSHDEINSPNALKINQAYQNLLMDLRMKLEIMLNRCREKYERNEQKLKALRDDALCNKSKDSEISKNYAYYQCGAPFFKNKYQTFCPDNMDYVTRKKVHQECFPLDFKTGHLHYWTFNDKQDLVAGVRKQMMSHIKSFNGFSIGQIRGQSTVRRSQNKQINEIRSANMELQKKPFDELYDLVMFAEEQSGKPLQINWKMLAFDSMSSRHNEFECAAMWNNYLKPQLNRQTWTEAEEQQLMDAAMKHNCQDWVAIAAELQNRSEYQCFVHYQTKFSEKAQIKTKVRWTKEEDEELLRIVEQQRMSSIIPWNKVAEKIKNRNKFQCYNRYLFCVKPGIIKTKFTTEEDCKIMAYVQDYGANFGNFPAHILPGRTSQQIRSRYQNALSRVSECNAWTVEEDQHLLDFVEANGTSNWTDIAKLLKTHTRLSCRTRYKTITHFLKAHPDAELIDVPRKKRGSSVSVTSENWKEKLIQSKLMLNEENKLTVEHAKFEEKLLRGEKPLYDYFRFSYKFDYDLQKPIEVYTEEDSKRNVMITKLLQSKLLAKDMKNTNFTNSQRQRLQTALQNKRLPSTVSNKLALLKKSGDCVMPINWNTTVGLRGVSLLKAAQNNTVKVNNEPEASTSEDTETFNASCSLLRNRFRQLFYWPALMSRTKILENSHQSFEENLDSTEGVFDERTDNAATEQYTDIQLEDYKPKLPIKPSATVTSHDESDEPITHLPASHVPMVKTENAVDFLYQMFVDRKHNIHESDDDEDEDFLTNGFGTDDIQIDCKTEQSTSEICETDDASLLAKKVN